MPFPSSQHMNRSKSESWESDEIYALKENRKSFVFFFGSAAIWVLLGSLLVAAVTLTYSREEGMKEQPGLPGSQRERKRETSVVVLAVF